MARLIFDGQLVAGHHVSRIGGFSGCAQKILAFIVPCRRAAFKIRNAPCWQAIVKAIVHILRPLNHQPVAAQDFSRAGSPSIPISTMRRETATAREYGEVLPAAALFQSIRASAFSILAAEVTP